MQIIKTSKDKETDNIKEGMNNKNSLLNKEIIIHDLFRHVNNTTLNNLTN